MSAFRFIWNAVAAAGIAVIAIRGVPVLWRNDEPWAACFLATASVECGLRCVIYALGFKRVVSLVRS